MGQLWAVLVGGALAIAAGVITQLMQSKRERARWLADTKKQEYRELLDSMTQTVGLIMDDYAHGSGSGRPTSAKLEESYNETLRVINTRIFIAKELEKACIFDRWVEVMSEIRARHNFDELGQSFGEIRKIIISLAVGDRG